MKIFTLGYGGRKRDDFINLLQEFNISTVVDTRINPFASALGMYKKAKDPLKGIYGLLANHGIIYISLTELGNPWYKELENERWRDKYEPYFDERKEIITPILFTLKQPICLLCFHKKYEECHREVICEYLAKLGHEIVHIV